jgi:ABC-type antimicrobial peptide transport system permease subunit
LSLGYVFKRLTRSWQLYIALLLGIVLAATFFAGINVGADTAAKQALDQTLSQTPVDLTMPLSRLSSKNITDAMQRISSVEGVKGVEALSVLFDFSSLINHNLSFPVSVIGISQSSRVYNGWVGGAPTLNENETYVWADSKEASKFQVGEVLPINVTSTSYIYPNLGNQTMQSFLLNLTVAGFAKFEGDALKIVTGQYSSFSISSPLGGASLQYEGGSLNNNVLIVNWEKTLAKLIDQVNEFSSAYSSPISTQILVYLDRGKLVNPWDISGSVARVNTVSDRIAEKVAMYSLSPQNYLAMILSNYQSVALIMQFAFISASLPVFFVAWYMGSTVSDVSMNLRRREIGLLLTKGFSRRQLLGIFLAEALLIGLVGGFIGVGLAFALTPVFVKAAGGIFTGIPFVSWDIVFLTVSAAVVITFLSAFQPSRRASNLPTVDALRQYVYVEDAKPYKKTWPWVAFILGSYKMIILFLGLNMFVEMQKIAASGSMLLSILGGIAYILDSVLTFVGPWLFVWGVTKLLIRGSLKFQELTSRVFRFLGDLGSLATKNVRRNPSRSAAIAFLVALIIAYSFQVTGQLASQQDFTRRNILFSVGADVSIPLGSGRWFDVQESNLTSMVNEIKKNFSDQIASITVEYLFPAEFSQYNVQFKAVDPESWLSTAYYENEWFSGRDVQSAFNALKSNNESIILERSYATYYDKKVGDSITVTLGEGDVKELEVAGFFGNEQPMNQIISFGPEGPSYAPSQAYWSYVPIGLVKNLGSGFATSDATILIKLKNGANGKAVADGIQALNSNIGTVNSVEKQLEEEQSNVISTGQLNVLRLGVIFVVLASSIGVALVALVSLKERGREGSIMSVRGLSFKQMVVMLLSENLAIIAFAVLLGTGVGLLIVRGAVASSNASSYTLVSMRVVFPPDAVITLTFAFTLIFASTILPVLFMAKRFGSNLQSIVRQA